MCRLSRHQVKHCVKVKDKRNAPIAQDARSGQSGNRSKVLLERFEHDFLHADQLVDQKADRGFAILDDDDGALVGRFLSRMIERYWPV